MIEFTKKEKAYIKEQILKEVFDICGVDPMTKIEDAGIDIRVRWTKGWKKDKYTLNAIPFSSAILPHLNYAIPYDWRRISPELKKYIDPSLHKYLNKYTEFGFYYMSTTEYDRNVKLQELLK